MDPSLDSFPFASSHWVTIFLSRHSGTLPTSSFIPSWPPLPYFSIFLANFLWFFMGLSVNPFFKTSAFAPLCWFTPFPSQLPSIIPNHPIILLGHLLPISGPSFDFLQKILVLPSISTLSLSSIPFQGSLKAFPLILQAYTSLQGFLHHPSSLSFISRPFRSCPFIYSFILGLCGLSFPSSQAFGLVHSFHPSSWPSSAGLPFSSQSIILSIILHSSSGPSRPSYLLPGLSRSSSTLPPSLSSFGLRCLTALLL